MSYLVPHSEDHHSPGSTGIGGEDRATGRPRHRQQRRRRAGRRLGHTPAPDPTPDPTPPGSAWTPTTTTRDDCGPRSPPHSPPAPRSPPTAASTPPGPRARAPNPNSSPNSPTPYNYPQPVRLILDDVHELHDPTALNGLHTLLRNHPTSLQLILSSRFDPPLSLPRLRLTGRLWELRADRLRFSPTETATLLERSGLSLTPTQIDTLHHRTGGWAAGLRLAAVALTQTTDHAAFLDQFSGNDSTVADYLTGEMSSALPDDTPRIPASNQHQRPRPPPRSPPNYPGARRPPTCPFSTTSPTTPHY